MTDMATHAYTLVEYPLALVPVTLNIFSADMEGKWEELVRIVLMLRKVYSACKL